jgi:hypothetical protein
VTFSSRAPTLGAGLSEAKIVDLADISIETMSDSTGQWPTPNRVVVADRRRGTVQIAMPEALHITAWRARLRALLRVIAAEFSALFLDESVIFGTGAIALRGVYLGRPVESLQVFVARERFGVYTAIGGFMLRNESTTNHSFLTLGSRADIEFREQFPGVEFSAVAAGATPTMESFGLKVASLQDLRKWKQALLDQTPDGETRTSYRGDLKQLDAVLNRR